MPVLYCGGLALYFFHVGGSVKGISAIGLGPTVLGLGIVGFLFCIPAIVKLMRFIPGPQPPRSGDGPDETEGFDPDAAIIWRGSLRSPALPALRHLPRPRAAGRPDRPASAAGAADGIFGAYSAAIWLRLSNCDQTPSAPSQLPFDAPLEYSVARCSKKLACSTPLRISTSQGNGWALSCL